MPDYAHLVGLFTRPPGMPGLIQLRDAMMAFFIDSDGMMVPMMPALALGALVP